MAVDHSSANQNVVRAVLSSRFPDYVLDDEIDDKHWHWHLRKEGHHIRVSIRWKTMTEREPRSLEQTLKNFYPETKHDFVIEF